MRSLLFVSILMFALPVVVAANMSHPVEPDVQIEESSDQQEVISEPSFIEQVANFDQTVLQNKLSLLRQLVGLLQQKLLMQDSEEDSTPPETEE